MNHPAFFNDVPSITMYDGLAKFLGACTDGIITYHYVDAVRLAGHSCPTVAGAYLMTRRALALLYPDQTPERGAIRVRFSEQLDEGVAGVIGSVVGLITGAAGPGGFKGIGHHFGRQNLLDFGCAVEGEVCFERTDTGASVQLAMNMSGIAPQPRTMALLRKSLEGVATQQEDDEFAHLWQDRVKHILIDHADDPELITLVPAIA